jgi:hypothetical protein
MEVLLSLGKTILNDEKVGSVDIRIGFPKCDNYSEIKVGSKNM